MKKILLLLIIATLNSCFMQQEQQQYDCFKFSGLVEFYDGNNKKEWLYFSEDSVYEFIWIKGTRRRPCDLLIVSVSHQCEDNWRYVGNYTTAPKWVPFKIRYSPFK